MSNNQRPIFVQRTAPTPKPKLDPARDHARPSATPTRVTKSTNGVRKSIREFLLDHSYTAAQALVDIMTDPGSSAKDVSAAASTILAYAVAKPAPEVASTGATGQLSLVKRLLTGAGPSGDVDGSGAAVTAEDVMLDPATTGQGVITSVTTGEDE